MFSMFHSQLIFNSKFKPRLTPVMPICFILNLIRFVPLCSRFARTVTCIIISGSPPLCILHPSSSGIQACYNDPVMLCDRPGRVLAVCVNPDQSTPLFWTDNVISTQRGHRVYSSQAWWGERGGQQWLHVGLWATKLGGPILVIEN